MEILNQGTEVITKSGKVRAVITGSCLRGGNISYELSYFSNSSHCNCWLYPFEFDVDDAEKQKPGFASKNQLLITNKEN